MIFRDSASSFREEIFRSGKAALLSLSALRNEPRNGGPRMSMLRQRFFCHRVAADGAHVVESYSK